jgi:hypothetical protein
MNQELIMIFQGWLHQICLGKYSNVEAGRDKLIKCKHYFVRVVTVGNIVKQRFCGSKVFLILGSSM